jgi:hypothetical protein
MQFDPQEYLLREAGADIASSEETVNGSSLLTNRPVIRLRKKRAAVVEVKECVNTRRLRHRAGTATALLIVTVPTVLITQSSYSAVITGDGSSSTTTLEQANLVPWPW